MQYRELQVPLSDLKLSPDNVRKTPPSPEVMAQFTASILDKGLIHPLLVKPAPRNGAKFHVVAGGRRLAAYKQLARARKVPKDHPIRCAQIPEDADAAEISLIENTIREIMHPADQVVAFARLADSGVTVAAIAARFGVSERTVEQRLRLGNVAPELIEAYRADEIDLNTLMSFAVTTDHARQLNVWERVSNQGYRPSAWQVKRLLTEERVPAGTAVARFVGVEAYEAAGGPVLRDLFADEHESSVWIEDAALLNDLAMQQLQIAREALATRWKWAEAALEVDWSTTARYGRIHPVPGEQTDEETAEVERLSERHIELANLADDDWTDALVEESQAIEDRLEAIAADVGARATFRPEDFRMAGCIATVGRDGTLQVIQGLVKPEDMPNETGDVAGGDGSEEGGDVSHDAGRLNGPAITTPPASAADPDAQARKEAGVGIGLADDLRAIRTTLVKAQLATDFGAAFDLMVFQLVRTVFTRGYTGSWHALDIALRETPDRPNVRVNDDDFAAWSPGEAPLADWSHLPFEWMEGEDDAACFAALRALPRADKETLFAAAVARTLKGQLAFEHRPRPELEATVAWLDIDFASQVRPTAAMFWSRIKKSSILDIARAVIGDAWAEKHKRDKKSDLVVYMEQAFLDPSCDPDVPAQAYEAIRGWALPGFTAFDADPLGDTTADDDPSGPSAGAAAGEGDPHSADADAEGTTAAGDEALPAFLEDD